MVFSSAIFLLLFLPLVLAAYYNPFCKKREFRNILLFLASLAFYAWGEPFFVLVLLLSVLVNYVLGLGIDAGRKKGWHKWCLILSLVYNVGLLTAFKYLGFLADNLSWLLGRQVAVRDIALPIGLSFFTFQMISYILDVYRQKAPVQKNPLYVGLYITMFPQLVAGPIVRYETIAAEIAGRQESWADFVQGTERFIVGLGKKVLLANYVAGVADLCFARSGAGELSAAGAWLGSIAYTLQIYFDFSGYSDMAIGLGRMFGFHFLENFRYPYVAQSITEFWRRWHISLSSWFRDYIYIPLGGSRRGLPRTLLNLFVVWFLTGLWHGANWTFVCWGLLYFVLLVIEKVTGLPGKLKAADKAGAARRIPAHLYTLFFVNLAWVLFRADSLRAAGEYLKAMFGLGGAGLWDQAAVSLLGASCSVLVAACIGSVPVAGYLTERFGARKWFGPVRQLWLLLVFLLSLTACVKASYSPFIYFNF